MSAAWKMDIWIDFCGLCCVSADLMSGGFSGLSCVIAVVFLRFPLKCLSLFSMSAGLSSEVTVGVL